MKKLLLSLVLLFIVGSTVAQTDNKIVAGKIDSLYSKIIGEQRKVWIYTPGMTSGNAQGQRFPVLYLLDGDAHFLSVVGLVQQLSQVNGNTVIPEMIVVGVSNTDRTRDLTPTHVVSDPPAMDSNSSRNTGGGKNFLAFLEKELIPHIDSAYPTAPYKILVGHSFGGLAVIDALTSNTKLFNAYIAIDPSMWYDHEKFLASVKTKLSGQKYSGTRLFIGIANTMPEGMTPAKLKMDKSPETRHIRSIFELDRFLKANPNNQLHYASKYYDKDSHSSVPLISEYDGLRHIFSYYNMTISYKDFTDSTAAIVSKYKKHYATVSKEMGYKVSPPELFINYMGYDAMAKKQLARAESLFKMNIENYPNSNNVYDSYADLLVTKKDTAGAVANYKKALAIQDNADTKRKLNSLEGKPVYTLAEQDLQKYAGLYEVEGHQVAVILEVKNGAIWSSVAGQPDYEFVPISPEVFTVKNVGGFTITFKMEGGRAIGFTSVQPNGTFKANLKK